MGFLKSNLLKAIEWQDSSKDTIIYKYPMDGRQIQFGSKLTVRDSQVAIFMNKGKIADILGPGTHILKARNIPILTQLLSLPFGFKSPFYSDVFFVNTKQFTNQKWGTANPITMRDSEFGTIRVRGYGSYAFKVANPETFLREISGTASNYTSDDINNYLRSFLISCLTDVIAESGIDALDLSANLNEFSKVALSSAKIEFEKIGLTLTNFIIENLSFPESVEKAIDARSSVGVMGEKMDEFIKFQSAQAIRDSANNTSKTNAGVEFGTSIALGEMLRSSLKSQSNKKATSQTTFCPECGTENKKTAKFCTECGNKLTRAKVCSNCKTTIPANAKFCPECGNKI